MNTKIKKRFFLFPIVISLGLLSFISALSIPTGTAKAACSLSQTNSTTLVADGCEKIDGVSFKNSGKSPNYTYTKNAKDKKGKAIACTATVKVTKSGASISGTYFKPNAASSNGSGYNPYGGNGGGTVKVGTDGTCAKLTTQNNVSIDKSGARKDTFVDTLKSSIKSELKCPTGNVNAYEACEAQKNKAVDTCVALNTSLAGIFSDINSNETAKNNIKDKVASCISGQTGSLFSAKAVKDAVNNGVTKGSASADALKDVEASDDSSEDEKTCGVDGIGWIVCPVLTFIGDINEKAYEFISQFLDVPSSIIKNIGTYNAWKAFRDIANVLFGIAFIIIIYSQLTGAGLDNYGIKKLLPKIIIAAILVNVSFWATAILVDISNIVGAGIYNLITNIDVGGGTAASDEGAWTKTIAPIILGGITVGLLLVFVLGPAALLAFALVMLILIGRQAFVMLLVVISPLAFVAYLLPNTESWFKKWWTGLTTVLMVYPVVGAIFGASALASKIMLNAAGDGEQSLAVAALAVSAVPLFAVPAVLKGSLAAAGSVGARISGMTDKAQGRAMKKGSERFKSAYDNSAYARGRAIRKQGRQKYKNEKFAEAVAGNGGGPLERVRRRAAAGIVGRGFTPAAKSAQATMATNAAFESDKAFEDDVRGASINQVGMSNRQVAAIASSGEIDGRKATREEYTAALDRTMSSGSFDERRAALEYQAEHKDDDNSWASASTTRQRAVKAAYAKGDQAIYGSDFGNRIVEKPGVDKDGNATGNINSADDLRKQVVKNANGGRLTADSIVQSGGSTKYLVDTANRYGTTDTRDAIRDAGSKASVSDATRSRYTDEINTHIGNLDP